MDTKTSVRPIKTNPYDASLAFYEQVQDYVAHLVINKKGRPNRLTAVSLLNRLLFLRFLDESRGFRKKDDWKHVITRLSTTLSFGSLSHLDRELFQLGDHNGLVVNSQSLSALVDDLLPQYSWILSENGIGNSNGKPQVRPWILTYIYERLVNNRETGSYFTPDRMAHSIVLHALEEWLVIQHEVVGGASWSISKALDCWHRRHLDDAAAFKDEFFWLETALASMRVVDLSVGGGAFLVATSDAIFELVMFCSLVLGKEASGASVIRRIFERTINGVDIQNEAIQVAKMRLWLLASELDALDSTLPLLPLPNFLHANALAPLAAPIRGQMSYLSDQSANEFAILLKGTNCGFGLTLGYTLV